MPDHHNEHGEIPFLGAPWACGSFGTPGHDYLSCPVCRSRYDMYLAAKGDLERFGLLAAS